MAGLLTFTPCGILTYHRSWRAAHRSKQPRRWRGIPPRH
jgi:hypothetical protein